MEPKNCEPAVTALPVNNHPVLDDPLEAAVICPFAFTVIFALVKLPALLFTLGNVNVSVLLLVIGEVPPTVMSEDVNPTLVTVPA